MEAPHMLVHGLEDNVGVVVVEGVSAGTDMLCINIEDDSEFRLTAKADVPIGHKVSLVALTDGDSVMKYGENIGRVVQSVGRGEHVHTHNLKTRRW